MTPERQKYAVREAQQRCPLLNNGYLKHIPVVTNMLVKIKVMPRIKARFQDNEFMKNSSRMLGGGDLY
jgi:hypothetical protein